MDIKCSKCGFEKKLDSSDFFEITKVLKEEGWDLDNKICPNCKPKQPLQDDGIITIDNNIYKLVRHDSTSAPCGDCSFFNRGTLKCNFPSDRYERQCEQTSGTYNGWNTKEYCNI